MTDENRRKQTALLRTWALLLGALAVVAFASVAAAGGSEPKWTQQIPLKDGRTFVTDGRISIDAALAKPSALPAKNSAAGSIIERYLAAPHPDEFGFKELRPGTMRRSHVAPSGVTLNDDYLDYLRGTLPAARVRFRMKGDLDPVVILLDGTAVGVVMPMVRAR